MAHQPLPGNPATTSAKNHPDHLLSTYPAEDPAHEPHADPTSGNGLIATAGFGCLVVALQQTLVVPAVPVLPQILGTSPVAVGWLVTATLLTGSLATPIIARLSDMFGRKRLLLISMMCVLVGSVLAPLGGFPTLLAGRALQGLGTALVPVAMAQMRDSLPGNKIAASLAILSATLGVGGGVGIPLGGLILQTVNWQALFWTSALLSVASIILIALVVPRHRPEVAGHFDLTGAVLLTIGVSALLVAISQGNLWGWVSPATLISAGVGVVVLIAWSKHQLMTAEPIVNLRKASSQPLFFTNLASLVMGVLMFTNLLLTTQVLQGPASEGGFEWSSAAAGLAMLPNAAAMFVVAPLTAWLANHWGPRLVLGLGGMVTVVGYLARMFASTNGTMVIVWATVIGIGVGIGYAALPMLIVRYTPPEHIGAANGVNALVRAIGTAIASAGVAALGSVMVATVGGQQVPAAAAFLTISLIAAIGGVITIVFALLAHGTIHSD